MKQAHKNILPRKATAGLILLVAFGLVFGLAWRARAAEFTQNGFLAPKEVIDDDVFVSDDEVRYHGTVNGDLFVNSSYAEINGTVNGNLIANSGVLVVNGQVNGSLIFTGQTLRLPGKVTGSLYAAGREIILEKGGEVQRNIFFAGLTLESQSGSTVGRDVFMTGYQTLLSGVTGRDVHTSSGALVINGKVGRDVIANVKATNAQAGPYEFFLFQNIKGTQPVRLEPAGLRVEPGAAIAGRLSYTSPQRQDGAIRSKPAGGVIFELKPERTGPAQLTPVEQLRQNAQNAIRDLVTLLLLGGLTLWLAPRWLNQAGEQVTRQPAPALLWGLFSLCGGFFAAFILLGVVILATILVAVTSLGGLAWTVFGVGSTGLALAFAIFLLLVSYGSKLVVGYWAGRLLLEKARPENPARPAWALVAGLVIYVLLSLIPLAGWLISLVVTLLGLGAIWLALRQGRRVELAPAAAPAPGD